MSIIIISAGSVRMEAELHDTPTAEAIWAALPIEGVVNTWGDEIYFAIPVQLAAEADARADVAVGDLGYWPTGHAFCIFFGATPASRGSEPRAASPVNVFGRVRGDATDFRQVADNKTITITRAE